MKAHGWVDPNDKYESKNFALAGVGIGEHVNLSVAGIGVSTVTDDSTSYSHSVWVSMRAADVDELITALQYWQKYKTFNKED